MLLAAQCHMGSKNMQVGLPWLYERLRGAKGRYS